MRRARRYPCAGRPASRSLKGTFKDAEGVPLLRRRERFTGQEVATRIIADRQRVAVALVAQQNLALVVSAPESVGVRDRGEWHAGEARPTAPHAARRRNPPTRLA